MKLLNETLNHWKKKKKGLESWCAIIIWGSAQHSEKKTYFGVKIILLKGEMNIFILSRFSIVKMLRLFSGWKEELEDGDIHYKNFNTRAPDSRFEFFPPRSLLKEHPTTGTYCIVKETCKDETRISVSKVPLSLE